MPNCLRSYIRAENIPGDFQMTGMEVKKSSSSSPRVLIHTADNI